jgi:hypothetical protein
MKKAHKKQLSKHNLPASLSASILEMVSMVHADGEIPGECKVICGPDENGEWRCVHVCPGSGGLGNENA